MLKRTALALGRSVKKCLAACKGTMQQPITIFSSCSLNNTVNEQYKTKLEPLDKRKLQTLCKSWQTDLTLDIDDTGLCDCSADNLFLQHYLVSSYVAACKGAQEVQFVKDFRINNCNLPLPFRVTARNIHTLTSKTLDLTIRANPLKTIIPKKKKDSSLKVIREVKPLKNYSSPALDKDFSYYLNLQKANKIQKDDKTIEKVPDNKKDIDQIWMNPQFRRQQETMSKCGKDDKKEEKKSGKECKETDNKKIKEKSMDQICKLREECSKAEKKIRAEMFLRMCKARAEKQQCTRQGKGDVKKALRKKCKKQVQDLKCKGKDAKDVKKELRKKCKKMVEDLKCTKMAESAKCNKGDSKENPQKQAEQAKCKDQKLKCQAAKLRELQKACQELADKIKCAKEAKRKELIEACKALVENDRLAKEKKQKAESKAGGDSCETKKQVKCGDNPDYKKKLEAERYLRRQCARLAEQSRCRKIREQYNLEKRAAELKKQCAIVANANKWSALDEPNKAKEQAQLGTCQKPEEEKNQCAKSAPSK
ncbi:axoneme-associated protein mst101(1)-like [Drosophila obscura]|uniref:axoneme-associated protein mst101(1)-like n=1 Tax=Drosophila obscura TaxID=7282 RepID=UPI001BB1CD70|nr:axoneme-associated protein mst101(1)-like [Drosophila obscura]